VIILLMWFYITGLMLLVGAEINSEIEAAAAIYQKAFDSSLHQAPAIQSRAVMLEDSLHPNQ